jgi:hypothetical protein
MTGLQFHTIEKDGKKYIFKLNPTVKEIRSLPEIDGTAKSNNAYQQAFVILLSQNPKLTDDIIENMENTEYEFLTTEILYEYKKNAKLPEATQKKVEELRKNLNKSNTTD